MTILLIDTAGPQARLALIKNSTIAAERTWVDDPAHRDKLLVEVDNLLSRQHLSLSSLNRIAVQAGPGHFGGLRQGIITAAMLAQAAHIPLVTVTAGALPEMIKAAREATPVPVAQPRYSP